MTPNSNVNKFGLSRRIPKSVMREVRQRCNFGCVICGKGIYQYEHFNPEFSEAKEHNPAGITLLCGACHDEKTRGLLTNEQIAKKDKRPFCQKYGNAFGSFHLEGANPTIQLGKTSSIRCKVALAIAGERVIWFTGPSLPGEGLHLNALIRDDDGTVMLKIQRNEWVIGDGLWDVQTTGNGIFIRSKQRNIVLIIRFSPPDRLKIERARIFHNGTKCDIHKDGAVVDGQNMKMYGGRIINGKIGVHMMKDGGVILGGHGKLIHEVRSELKQTSCLKTIWSKQNLF